MGKIFIIIKREYLQTVRKKSFLIMTFLGPILMAALMIAPTLLMHYGKETQKVAVCDKLGIFQHLDSSNDKDIRFYYVNGELNDLKDSLITNKYDILLYIPDDPIAIGGMVYSTKSLNTGVMSTILAAMKRDFTNTILVNDFRINKDSLDSYVARRTDMIALGYTHIDESGMEEVKPSYLREIQLIIGIIVGIVLYFFIFMYCSMVLRSVLEEKTNRIVEVIISSVKPVHLMIGKIVGVALIGLTQFVLWIVFTFVLVGGFYFAMPEVFTPDTVAVAKTATPNSENIAAIVQNVDNSAMGAILDINYLQLIICFAFYFIFGYFLYASLYAAIGAAVDNDTDSQQFIAILSSPMILCMILSTMIVDNPDGQVAFWLSIIPFTSPIVMMMRLPAGAEVVQNWELFLSISVLVLTCAFAVWLAAKIYRTGILMYGKKITYRELWKWLKYKN